MESAISECCCKYKKKWIDLNNNLIKGTIDD
jgi:hypothetical protein